jgi:hypothetical protein
MAVTTEVIADERVVSGHRLHIVRVTWRVL